MPLTPQETQQIIDALKRKANSPCPRCNNNSWNLAEEFAPVPLWPIGQNVLASQGHIPAALTICTNCGYIALYATKTLCGIPPPEPQPIPPAPPIAPGTTRVPS